MGQPETGIPELREWELGETPMPKGEAPLP